MNKDERTAYLEAIKWMTPQEARNELEGPDRIAGLWAFIEVRTTAEEDAARKTEVAIRSAVLDIVMSEKFVDAVATALAARLNRQTSTVT